MTRILQHIASLLIASALLLPMVGQQANAQGLDGIQAEQLPLIQQSMNGMN